MTQHVFSYENVDKLIYIFEFSQLDKNGAKNELFLKNGLASPIFMFHEFFLQDLLRDVYCFRNYFQKP